ncbi:amidohydrolase family protein [Flavobacterium wongokense]|uniref:amidohydrolase family protein n=1 Tax=Flavobacterium wongokense TaxID=2910674 RepID=UPI001F3D8761|nr:amidohydrolase family protein [Flavobacterium sp. WG47]MCF6131691.1 amidohydrolase family protein [Flavobacterium sp. WG47]
MQKIVDIHSHMFNLKYLPVAGILKRHKIPHFIAKGVESLLLRHTKESYPLAGIQGILKYKDDEDNTSVTVYIDDWEPIDYGMDEIADLSDDEIANAITQFAVVGDLKSGDLSVAIDEYEKQELRSGDFFMIVDYEDDEALKRHRAGLLQRMINKVIRIINAAVNYGKWFLFMTNSEKDIYKYIEQKDEPGVVAYLHLMMDVDRFLNEDPDTEDEDLLYRSRFNFATQQVQNMKKLNDDFPKLIGFVAFNPARKNWLEIIENARANGFKGVKFYPPLGYKASGGPYADRIKALFAHCQTHNIPVFTHCNNQGFEAWPLSGYNSNPVFWEEALAKYPNLILCLGHAGGGHGWFAKNDPSTDITDPDLILAANIKNEKAAQMANWNNSYAAMVYKLCVKYDNVYCDASYLDEIIDDYGNMDDDAKKLFTKRLKKLFEVSPKFAERIMYGSDWHMLFQEGKNRVYLKRYIELFDQPELAPYKDAFFYGNAEKYLRRNF